LPVPLSNNTQPCNVIATFVAPLVSHARHKQSLDNMGGAGVLYSQLSMVGGSLTLHGSYTLVGSKFGAASDTSLWFIVAVCRLGNPRGFPFYSSGA